MWRFLLGGGIFLPLIWAMQVWTLRRHQLRKLDGDACPICRTPFAEAIVSHRGGAGRRVRARLDRFQRRFASFVVRCEECGSDLVYTEDGAFICRLADRP